MFALSKIFWWLAQPMRLWLIITCIATLLLFTKYLGLGRLLLTAASVYFIALIFLPIHLWLTRPLEQRFPSPELPESIDGIIVLGGAVDQFLTEAHGQPSLNAAAERMTEALKLTRQYPNAKLVFSGGTAEVNPRSDFTEADVAEAFFVDLGFEKDKLLFENQSRNTYENAVFSKALIQPKENETWLLITSAFHMPRSVGIFRQQNWKVIPYPVDYRVGHNPSEQTPIFFSEKLTLIDLAAKEWVGLVAYRLLGRSNALFPKP